VRPEDRALALIEKIKVAKDATEVLSLLGLAAAEYGFEACAIATIPDDNQQFERFQFVRQWPVGWFEHYVKRGHLQHDPVIRQVRKTIRPFRWSQAASDPAVTERGSLVMKEAAEFGLYEGFCVPLITRSGRSVNVTFGGRKIEMSSEDEAALQLISVWAHIRVLEVLGDRPRTPKLSGREIEVIKWAAGGLRTNQIAEKLHLSSETVETYVRNACRKLEVVTRTQAAVEAVRLRII